MKIPAHFQLKAEHPNTYEIHDTRDQKSFHIPKSGLDLSMHAKLAKIPKYFDGGPDIAGVGSIVAPDQTPTPDQAPAPDQPQPQGPAPGGASGSFTPPSPAAAPVIPADTPASALAKGAPNAQSTMDQFNQNSKDEAAALGAKGQAESDALTANSDTLKSANEKMGDFFKQSQQDLWNQNVENQNLAEGIANQKIDPKNYVHNMGTLNKVGTAIALAVGGIGAGLTHSPNLAYESLQKSIANDIEAQKDNLNTKKSLLADNLKKYGDMRAATTATMMQMNSMAQGQIAATTAQYGAKASLANSQYMGAQLKNQNMMLGNQLQQQVLDQKIKQHLAGGDVANDNPLDYVKYVVPPAEQAKVATEIGDAAHVAKNHDKLMDLWDQAAKEQTVLKTGAGFLRTSPAITAITALADPIIHDQDGRVTPEVKKDFGNLLPSTGSLDSTMKTRRDAFESYLNNKANAPIAKTYGIDINNFSGTKPSISTPTKTVNGITYKRGPNGQAIRVN